MLGSCFSDEIGEQMKQRELNVTCNPFGTLYNPLSIVQAINYKLPITNHQSPITNHQSPITNHQSPITNDQLPITNDQFPLVEYDGMWHSMFHHGSFSRADKHEAEQAVADSIQTMQQALQDASVIIVTFGTAWVYEMVNGTCPNGKWIVGNCHKLPESMFTRRRLSVDEIIAAWRPILDRYPDKHWLFTVSPIRHIKDGLHENQLSKATLLMAIEQLIQLDNQSSNRQSSNRQYFPSYEIMLDELRDYRFYADDLVHPSSLAVQYIWERFAETFCTPQTRNEMNIRLKHWKQTQHRPLHHIQ